ncbi:hypothetical protein Q1695_014035 [Nippostrongylus brasiliensis]|nr:hypothetical protein Q1695_014035 [Nippostrongylus brasiliensis]
MFGFAQQEEKCSSSFRHDFEYEPQRKRARSPSPEEWTDDQRLTLINEVMNIPQLWDVRDPSYKYRHMDTHWPRVVDNVNLLHSSSFSVESAKQQWKNLRDGFVRKHRERKQVPTGSSSVAVPPKWRFYESMLFLLGTINSGKRRCNVRPSSVRSTDPVMEKPSSFATATPPEACESLPLLGKRVHPGRGESQNNSFREQALERVCSALERRCSEGQRPSSPRDETAVWGSFYTYVRLYPNEFEALHDKLARKLSHIVSHRAPIPSRQRLCIYLRFTGHGSSFSNLSGEFAIGISTACTIAHEVARAIIDELHDCAFPTPNASTWAMALEGFRTRWDYPAAMGALDGKHIACVCPKRSGSLFYNYKNYYSIVLLALVDANYKCVLYDLGAAGRSSDAGVFMTSEMKTFLEDNDGDFPVPVDLDGMGTVPCHFLVDQGFRLTTRFLRPYSNAEAAYDSKKRYFNYKMNSARRVVENYFGILAGRFRLLLRRVHGTPEHIKDIVQSLMILHNLLVDAIGGDTVVGRYSINPVQDDNARFDDVDRTTDDAKLLRDTMKNYFCIRDCIR